ncbi:type II secretion system protein GspF [Candidatus Falkowbacteria bacterium]|nr:type II secretion system protein GspF [Candidatus Falkowbacteria bacterium]
MPIFRYKAFDYQGNKTQGLISGFNKNAAAENLNNRGFEIISIEDKTDSWELKLLVLINPIKIKDLVVFSRQFSVMISANLALVQSLKIVAEQTENIALKSIISEIAYEVDGGASLSSALAKRSKIFTDFYVNVVKSGETSGKLDDVLNYLADEMEKDYDMMSRIKGAMIYPAFVLTGLVVVGTIMMVVVVPKLTEILQETGSELPFSTKIVIGVSDFLISYWIIAVILVVGMVLGVRVLISSPAGKRWIDSLKLKLPVFGKLFQYIYMVRFTRSMKTLIAGGVNITKALSIVSEVVGNEAYRSIIEESAKEVQEGNTLSSVFEHSSQVPRMVPQMINVGERTGKLELVLEKITDFYAREINNILSNLVTLLEPIIMIVMGVAVGIMVAAVIMPMYNMANQF